MKSLLFVISALAIFAAARAQSGEVPEEPSSSGSASFNPVSWCASRDYSRNLVQYIANPYNETEFYQCERTRSGIVAHLQACKKCFVFSNDIWQCVQEPGCVAPTEAPITEVITYDLKYCYVKGNGAAGLYIQPFRQGSVRYKYFWYIDSTYEVEMSCAPGTFFDPIPCKCVWCDGSLPCAGSSNRIFTLNFDSVSAQNGIYFDLADSIKFVAGSSSSSLAAEFDGLTSDIEVPYFQNNEFSQFTFVGSFKRYSGSLLPQGILSNGGNPLVADFQPPSIYIVSLSPTQVKAGIRADNVEYSVVSSAVLAADEWVSLILRYNGTNLDFWVNGVYNTVAATGTTDRLKDDLKFGLIYDTATGFAQYFKGLLDDLSFYRTAIKVPVGGDDLPPV